MVVHAVIYYAIHAVLLIDSKAIFTPIELLKGG